MKPVIHTVGCPNHPNVRTWDPDDPTDIAEELTLSVGPKGTKQADMFTILVATPKGLARLPAQDGIIATRPLLVMDRYDYQLLWKWLQKTVSACEGETWLDCVGELRIYFSWEHEMQGDRFKKMAVNPEVKSVASWGIPDIRTWEPDDPYDVAVELMVDIGWKKKGADTFTIGIATPKGLSQFPGRDGVVAVVPLVVMDRFDYLLLCAWLENTVSTCKSETWMDCVKKLRVHFLWEYEGMKS